MSDGEWTRVYVDRSRGDSWAVWHNSGDGRGQTFGRRNAQYYERIEDAVYAANNRADLYGGEPGYGRAEVIIRPRAQAAIDAQDAADRADLLRGEG